MSEKVFKIESSYRFDQYLMHLIQSMTSRPPAEILAFFHELAGQVSEIGVQKRTGRGIRKEIVDYFPGTSIPFQLMVKGRPMHRRYNPIHGSGPEGPEVFSCQVEVGFPEQRTYMKEDDLKNLSVLLMEKALLGGDDVVVPDFNRPEIKTPKIYKALMNSFAGRESTEEPKKRRKKTDG